MVFLDWMYARLLATGGSNVRILWAKFFKVDNYKTPKVSVISNTY